MREAGSESEKLTEGGFFVFVCLFSCTSAGRDTSNIREMIMVILETGEGGWKLDCSGQGLNGRE